MLWRKYDKRQYFLFCHRRRGQFFCFYITNKSLYLFYVLRQRELNCLVLSDLGMFQSGGAFSLFSLIHLGLIWLLLNYRELGDSSEFLFTTVKIFELKPLQNKKGQKNLGYPRKKQSFSL